jgi:predicted CXXCH cytochrome family protein
MRRLGAIRTLLLTASLIALAPATTAWATIDNLKSYKQAYPGKDAKQYSCKVCHDNAIGQRGDLNAYGLALQKLPAPANPKKLTEPDYRLLESLDTDGDGATDFQELEAGTDPTDPASTPPPVNPTGGETKRDDPPSEASYVGAESCAACHAKEWKEFQQSTHARISIPGELNVQGCEMCHGPGSLHVEAGGGRGVGGIINPRKDPNACFQCHLDKQAELRLPYHHPILEGKMSCTDCHSPHGAEVRPWSSTSVQDINEACFRCHKEQRGPFVWEHEALREGCTTCHKVHGSIHENMLVVRDNNLCLRCHTQMNFPTIGKSGHGSRLPQGTCFSAGCHTAVHGSNFDDHLRY